jgi:two-component system invasion response regulator UvrY
MLSAVCKVNIPRIMKKITVLIAEDHTMIRESLALSLNSRPDLSVIAECSTAEEAIETARSVNPEVILMAINLPGVSGFEATRQILKFLPGTKIIALSMHSQTSYARKMFQCGALGYITKNSPRHELLAALNDVMAGKKYICEETKDQLTSEFFEDESADRLVSSLSKREIEVIEYLKKGYSSKEIAVALHLSVKTLEAHRYNILKKLRVKNTAALINFMSNYVYE